MTAIWNAVRPAIVGWLVSEQARQLLVEVLERLVERTDNEVDDMLLEGLKRALRVEE